MSMLQSSSFKGNNSSKITASSRIGGQLAPKPKQNFIMYSYRKITSLFNQIYNFFKKFMWVGSTGFIVLILPFTFAYLMEMQRQLSQQMGGRGDMMM